MTTRYTGMAYEQLFLPRLTGPEIGKLAGTGAMVVLPIAAMEQHGPHLPVFTDNLIGEGMLTEAFRHLTPEDNIWLLPHVPYGKSNEHADWSGTVTLSAQTLLSVIMDIANSLARNGFKRLVLFNTHGGNTDLLNIAARDIREKTGMYVFRIDGGGLDDEKDLLTQEERMYGIHAGDSETSMIMALHRDWVHDNKLPNEFPPITPDMKIQFSNKRFAWLMKDLSSSGACGNAQLATEEKGKAILASAGRNAAELFKIMAEFTFDQKNVPIGFL
ncbi:creatininase family protein [Paenibacillus sp. Marseille-Q4541]|uniref:creatininase family protein n=1 Tax=Paenibacillus sp. Marseille-Q4541 TaxID=2831522 RepID=UPI001BA876D0|nr:creatininase family protein [Paenibacillus sp. Marseille-Q4541]